MRLIDADKVKEDSRKLCINCNLNGSDHCRRTCIVNLICDRMDLMPTIEPERTHGEWEYIGGDGTDVWRCSNCHNFFLSDEYNFCSNCGTDMRSKDYGKK